MSAKQGMCKWSLKIRINMVAKCKGHMYVTAELNYEAGLVHGHCCVGHVFDVKNVTLESFSNSVPSLSYIFAVTPIAFQAINEIIALTCAVSFISSSFVVMCICEGP